MAESSPLCAEDTGPWVGAGGGAKTAASSSPPTACGRAAHIPCHASETCTSGAASAPAQTGLGSVVRTVRPSVCLSVCWSMGCLSDPSRLPVQNSMTSLRGQGGAVGFPSGGPSAWPSWRVPSQTRAFGRRKDAHESGDWSAALAGACQAGQGICQPPWRSPDFWMEADCPPLMLFHSHPLRALNSPRK